ncbi:hypothetical protein [Aliivibrio sifiae]|uniref:Uncharacterized protein n=1 Tax=Aliivibrio sifiae TaxID=566293 RepID=A0A2S7X0I6_9GAMM|nr:hypothetical protein [Aliivibrio sifiae]PQJ83349.1 hypothetical protein BTO22_18350 [Aliivibrio sifiae]
MLKEKNIVSEVVQIFKNFEQDLFIASGADEIQWKNIRSGVYYRVSEIKGYFKSVKPNLSKLDKVQSLINIIVNSVKSRATKPITTKLVVMHPRTIAISDKWMDAYSYPYFKNDKDVTYWSRSSIGERQKSLSKDSKSLDFMYWPFMLFKLLAKLPFRSREFKCFYKSLSPLFANLECEQADFEEYLYSEYLNFNYLRNRYYELLSNSPVKELYLVDSYSKNAAIIDACHRLGILVIEFQHGIISNYHLGYSVGQPKRNFKLFPDKFLAWGPQWINGCHLPESINIDYIEPFYKRRIQNVTKKNKLVIISQSVIGEELAEFVLTKLNLDSFDEVTFKLHPSEISKMEIYQVLFSHSKIRMSNQDIYQELNESTTVIGVFSTAILEAVDFDCKVYFAPLQGAEYIADNPILENIINSEFYVND